MTNWAARVSSTVSRVQLAISVTTLAWHIMKSAHVQRDTTAPRQPTALFPARQERTGDCLVTVWSGVDYYMYYKQAVLVLCEIIFSAALMLCEIIFSAVLVLCEIIFNALLMLCETYLLQY